MQCNNTEKIIQVIKNEKKFTLFTHESSDGDCIGSQLAFARALKKLKKDVICVGERVPLKYQFLYSQETIHARDPRKDTASRVAVFFDTTSLDRVAGASVSDLKKYKTLINIDHHVSNDRFGTYNLIDASASSVGEMIYTLLVRAAVEISPDIAAPLYVAILTDTGMFQYANTTRSTHAVIGALLESGIDQFRIYQHVYENVPLAKLKLLQYALATLQIDGHGKIVSMWLTRTMFKKAHAREELSEDVINYARSVEGSVVAVVFKETEKRGVIKVSLRSKSKKADVNKIAACFGGGGHSAAAGCTIRGAKKVVEKKVINTIKKVIVKV
ncbi:MAG: DHH family phosphoesterase [Candidatus Ancaeobacter aquaticus]|nr:DHH family phosphoesterase [Candidatus Ancaeobacter aquaticus]